MVWRKAFITSVVLGMFTFPSLSVNSDAVLAAGFVEGISGPEDLVPVPGTRWIVVGGLGNVSTKEGLYLIDKEKKHSSVLFPDRSLDHAFLNAAYPHCQGPVDASAFSAHGLNLHVVEEGVAQLYVVNHGSREAIEVFRLHYDQALPELAWTGCVPLPEGAMANGVAGLPNGGIVATHFIAPEYFPGQSPMVDRDLWKVRLQRGEPTGYASLWYPHSGWERIPGTEGSGPNGVEVSEEGDWIWIALWGDRKIIKLSLADPNIRHVRELDFMPDNLRWGDDGMLWVAGASGDAADYFACSADPGCHGEFVVARLNPDSLEIELTPLPEDLAGFGDATTATVIDGAVWVGANPSKRVLYFPATRASLLRQE